MKKYISIWLLLALPAFAQRQPLPPLNITVSNCVTFHVEHTTNGDVDVMGFLVTVVNNGDEPIPDLRPDNMVRYSIIYIDGSPSPPFGCYNGPGSDRITNTLSKGESDSFGWGQWMTSRDTNPPVITVQWNYLGVKSDILMVDRVNKTVKSIGVKNLIAEQPLAEQWINLGTESDNLLRDKTDKTVCSSEADKIHAEQAGPAYPPQGVGSAAP